MGVPGIFEILVIMFVILVLFGIPLVIAGVVIFFFLRRGRDNDDVVQTCPHCGFHVRGQPVSQCPQCGAALAPPEQ